MKKLQLVASFLFIVSLGVCQLDDGKTRLIILADMGNEPDEVQQMYHLLMCSNEFDLEGLIAVTGTYLQPANKNPYKQVLHPELFHMLIDGYEEVEKLVAKLRVYENGVQDNSGVWICFRFPDIHWFRSNYQTYCYGGPAWEGAVDGSGNRMNLGPDHA